MEGERQKTGETGETEERTQGRQRRESLGVGGGLVEVEAHLDALRMSRRHHEEKKWLL